MKSLLIGNETFDVSEIPITAWDKVKEKFRKAVTLRKERKIEQQKLSQQPETQSKKQTKLWTTFFRRNINLYIEWRLKIHLHPFQHLAIYLISISDIWFGIASRGISKTFITATYAVAKCLLYPYCDIVITSSTLEQGSKMVKDKIDKELIDKLSPILKYFTLHEVEVNGETKPMIKVNTGKDLVELRFFNGSVIQVLPPMDSARGSRGCVMIYDECRLLRKSSIDDIFSPMKRPRPAVYMQKYSKYAQNPIYQEKPQEVYITSARFKSEWFYNAFKRTVKSCFVDTNTTQHFFAGDIYLALTYGLKSWSDWRIIQKNTNELSLRMEYLNEMIGEVEDAYFSLDLLKRLQVMQKGFSPPTINDLLTKVNLHNPEKRDNDTRIISVDFAFSNRVKGRRDPDLTVILCMNGRYKNGKFEKRLDYIETLGGGESEATKLRIRELFFDYQADYLVLDLRSGGEVLYNDLTAPFKHTTRPTDAWNEHGFTVTPEESIQILPKAKLDDLRNRTIDPNPIPCIIPIQGSPEFNSNMWQSLHRTMRDGNLKLLIDDTDKANDIETNPKKYHSMTSNERMRLLLPYVQTSFLVIEAISLRQQIKEGRVKLSEPANGTKDRVVALGYGNTIFDKIEVKKSKQEHNGAIDMEDWSCIMNGF